MLIISKKKLTIFRTIMLCGITVFLMGGCMAIGLRSGSILVAIAGILIALAGAVGVDSIYRCPKCGKNSFRMVIGTAFPESVPNTVHTAVQK